MPIEDDRAGAGSALDDGVRVRRVAEIASALGATRLHDRALAFAERIDNARIYVACVGQVKRGKSSLLNALIGEPLLPTGLVPVTAVPTIIRHSDRRHVCVHFRSGVVEDAALSDIAQFVGEVGNPNNIRGVDAVEVFVPNAILEHGLCLIDTPGLGSIVRGAGSLTRAQIPHIDAAIVVIGVDPPLSGEELELASDVAKIVDDLIVVLNKADRFAPDERETARTFAAKAIAERIGRSIGPVLELSAKEAFSRDGPPRDWPRLVAALTRLTSDNRSTLVRAALRRGAERLIDECLAELTELGRAAYAPVAQLEDRLEKLRAASAGTAFDWLALRHFIARASARARHSIQARRLAFLAERIADAGYGAARAVRYSTIDGRRELHKYGMEVAETIAHRELEEWSQGEANIAAELERDFAAQLAIVARAALADVSVLEHTSALIPAPEDGLGISNAPSSDIGPFASALAATNVAAASTPRSFWRQLAYHLSGMDRLREIIGQEARLRITQLLELGSAQMTNALVNRLEEIGAFVELRVHATLHDAVERADRAIALTRDARERDAEIARHTLDGLAEWRREVLALRQSSDERAVDERRASLAVDFLVQRYHADADR